MNDKDKWIRVYEYTQTSHIQSDVDTCNTITISITITATVPVPSPSDDSSNNTTTATTTSTIINEDLNLNIVNRNEEGGTDNVLKCAAAQEIPVHVNVSDELEAGTNIYEQVDDNANVLGEEGTQGMSNSVQEE